MKLYILSTKSGRRTIVRASSEEVAVRDHLKPRKFTIPWEKKEISFPGGEDIEQTAPLGIMLRGEVHKTMLS